MARLFDQLEHFFRSPKRERSASGPTPTRPSGGRAAALTAMLEAVNLAARSILAAHGPWDESFTTAMDDLGQALKACRLFVFENQVAPDGETRTSLQYCWAAEGMISLQQNPNLQNISLAQVGLDRWETELAEDRTIHAGLKDLPRKEQRFWSGLGSRSLLVAPVIVDGQWWGFVGVDDCQTERYWTEAEESTLKVISSLLGAIVQRSRSEQVIQRLYTSEREQRQLAQVLQDVGIQLSTTLNYDAIIDRLLEQVRRVVPYDTASVFTVREGRAEIIRLQGFEQMGEEAARSASKVVFNIEEVQTIRTLVETRRPVIVPDTSNEPGWVRVHGAEHVRSWASVPIISQDRIYAILALDKMERGFYNQSHAELLSAFAVQASLALQNAQLFAETTEMLGREQALNELIRSISSTLDLPTALIKLLRLAAELVGGDCSALALFAPDGGTIRSAYSYNLPKALEESTASEGLSTVWEVTNRLEPLLVVNCRAETDTPEAWIEAGVQGYIAVPVITGEERMGILSIFSLNPQKRFTERDLALMESVGRQAAVTIQNVWLFQALRRRADEAETLRQASSAVTSALDLSMVLDRILIHAGQVINYDSAAVFLLEEDRLHLVAGKGFPVSIQVVGEYFSANDPLFAEMRERSQPIILMDAAREERFANWGANDSIHGWIGVPLIAQGTVIGFLTINSREVGAYDKADATLMQSFANEAAIAIEKARLFKQVQQLAVTNSLTGLFNRRYFFEMGQREFRRAQRNGRPLSLILMDIDQFKMFNDTYGHLAGDRVLNALARHCQQAVRELDFVARYGGEEFVILLPETDLEKAYAVAERIRSTLADMLIDIGGTPVWISVSFGVAESDPECADLEELFKRADLALYVTKDTGKGMISTWKKPDSKP